MEAQCNCTRGENVETPLAKLSSGLRY